jgi:phosphatidylglycerol:prolipoprotein diacylglycerol transferase
MFPKLITIGSFFIPTYGTLVAIGFLVALWITVRLARRAGLPAEPVTNLAIYCALAGLLGAKIFMILFDWREYFNDPKQIFTMSTLQAAGVYQGGLLLAIVTAIVYMRRNKLPALATCDVFAPGIAAGHAIGRIGCFMAGCCWGTECHLPWAVTFTNIEAHNMTDVPLGTPLHPAQLYESLSEALIFLLLYRLIRKPHATGEVIGWYLALYSTARFTIEFVRFHEQGLYFGLSITQWISLGTLAAGIWLLIARRHAPKLQAITG